MDIQDKIESAISHLDACKAERINAHHGSITVLCGPPYAGKTARLNSIATNHYFANRIVQQFTYGESQKPKINRKAHILDSRGKLPLPTKVLDCDQIHSRVRPETDTVCIDNASQLEGDLLKLCRELADEQYIDVYVAGRDMFPTGAPQHFGELLCDAEKVEKLLLPCMRCRTPTNLWRLVKDKNQSSDTETLCRKCSDRSGVLPFERPAVLTIVTGPPYAGKADEYLRVIKNKLAAKRAIQVFYSLNGRSHPKIEAATGDAVTPHVVGKLAHILRQISNKAKDIFIDSLHEFPDVTEANIRKLETLIINGTNVFITARATDTQNLPVTGLPKLLCMADEVTVMLGVCDTCRRTNANRTVKSDRHQNPAPPFVTAKPGESLISRCRHHSNLTSR